MINEKINIYDDVEALCEGFTSFLKEQIDQTDQFVLSLSGGTTPKALFEYWTNLSEGQIDWSKVSFFWGDERCVSPDDAMSNFGVAKALFFDKVSAISTANIHRVCGEQDPSVEADRYAQEIDEFVPQKQGVPAFDIMILGLGDDGHTVSIFPHQIELWDSSSLCVEATHPQSGMKRVSMTGKVVNNSRNVVFLVTGKSKAEKVQQIILERQKYVDRYPAAKVSPMEGNLIWFLDRGAASLL